MKCPKCGAAIKEGFLYCSECGEEIRIVPDYEPEIFLELSESISSIAEGYEAQEGSREADSVPENPAGSEAEPGSLEALEFFEEDMPLIEEEPAFKPSEDEYSAFIEQEAERRKKKQGGKRGIARFRIAFILVAGTVFVAVFLVAIFRFNRYFDYDIQYAEALSLHDEGKYEESLNIAKHALSLNSSEKKTRLLIADDYSELKKYDESNAVLFSMLDDGGDVSIYDRIIDNYLAVKDYDSVISLLSETEDEELLERYSMYFATDPEFGVPGGEYDKDVRLTLSAKAPGVIYYTTDGSVPGTNSLVYKTPIEIEEGETTVSAIFVNEFGVSSDPVSRTYSISYPTAKPPKLLVSSGSYEIPRMIRVDYPDHYKVYYEKGGKDPNENSTEYKRPIEMPLGASEFRFVSVDDKGRMSEVVTGKYELKMTCYIDMDTALNAVKIQLMSKGENSLLNEYKCSAGIGYQDNSFYLIDEYTYSGSKTGRKFAVDTKTGSLFEATWSSEKQDYLLAAI
ncbi:MAG: chitobiase/beta-hexosaminidase C-terminal domain-containing protein [Lachnospiraceae bacterium]|nr:chitobiase/beta-hexosaminidase C-terminal domain-containing protein [Lachnospiraceae bacterium]